MLSFFLTLKFFSRPDHLNENFIFPNIENFLELDEASKIGLSENYDFVVRFAASFDMGWTTRGTGRSYNSFSGFAALLGFFSHKILSYVTLNRKCAKCDEHGYPPDHPECRKNYAGSAKGMEPRAAEMLVKESPILKDCNTEWAVPICDNDSGIIASLKNSVDYEIIKHADKNHTSGGLTKSCIKYKQQIKKPEF